MPAPDPTSGPTSPSGAKGSSTGADATPTTVSGASDAASPTDAGQQSAASTPASTRGAGKDKGPACPTCGGALEAYLGEAAHKLGSCWCHACGVRHRLSAEPKESSNG